MGHLSFIDIAVTGRTYFLPSFWISNLILSLVWQGYVRRAFAEAASRRQGQNSVAFQKAQPRG
jgi:hypothetical protein